MISYTNPDFNYEWGEAQRYDQFVKIGRIGWINQARKGYAVRFSEISADIQNVNLHFESLNEFKKIRFLKSFERSEIEMPIALKISTDRYDLMAGNTRLAGLIREGIDPMIWIVQLDE